MDNQKSKLLLAMLALCALMVCAVLLGSEYAPVVGPCREIEELWAIEDERMESGAPLVTALENHGVPLAYDEQANTFYCTLGLEHGEEWPDIHLTAPGARGVTVCFADDYGYDWCDEAIREGYAYQLMAYTEDEYAYFDIVFTGLPIISISTQAEITTEDSPVQVAISDGDEGLKSCGRIHTRGGSTLLAEKMGYRLEFTRRADGSRKVSQQVPGFGIADDIILLACASDETKMRDRLSWDMYAMVTAEDESFGRRRTAYAELFIDGQYEGIYLMVEPIDCEEELAKAGEGHLSTDSVYRTAVLSLSRDRMYYAHPMGDNSGYELYYAFESGHEFDHLFPYLELVTQENDEAFCQKALACVDLDSALRYVLLVQAGGMTDNVFNNMYMWACSTPQGMMYRFAPWDMDLTWGAKKEDIGQQFENWMHFPVIDRMINLDAGGVMREKLADTWAWMKEAAFNEENLERLIARYAHELGDSGAMARDAERWQTQMYDPDGYDIISFAAVRFMLLDYAVDAIVRAEGEPVKFLAESGYGEKGGSMLDTLAEMFRDGNLL